MGILFVAILASAAVSEALACALFDSGEVPQPSQNPAAVQVGGSGEKVEEGENGKAKSL